MRVNMRDELGDEELKEIINVVYRAIRKNYGNSYLQWVILVKVAKNIIEKIEDSFFDEAEAKMESQKRRNEVQQMTFQEALMIQKARIAEEKRLAKAEVQQTINKTRRRKAVKKE